MHLCVSCKIWNFLQTIRHLIFAKLFSENLRSSAIPFAAKIPGLPTDLCAAAYENLVIDTRNICGGMAGLTTCKVGNKL